MAVTLINKPIGHKLAPDLLSATVSNASGDALITTSFTHGLLDGSYIYITSDLASLNGFRYVDQISSTTFKVRQSSADSDYVSYKQSANITYQVSIRDHIWQCVHLPIVYELNTNEFPVNQLNSATVSSFADSNGYTQITLSNTISVLPSNRVYLLLSGDNSLSGVYKVLSSNVGGTVFTIELPYDSTNIFTGITVRIYLNNYFIGVNVYVGFPDSHRWESEMPFELITTLKLIPDADGNVKFSVSEVVKSYINTRNNLTLDTLPNNLDFWKGFYISYYESHDIDDNGEVVTYTGSTTTEPTYHIAVNAKLPFKNVHSGFMSDYIDEDTYYAKWLTLQDRPVIVIGQYFDISFLFTALGDVLIEMDKYLDGDLISTENVILSDPGFGLLRVPLYFTDDGFDELCITAYKYSGGGGCNMPSPSGATQLDLDPVTAGVFKVDWDLGTSPSVTLGATESEYDEWRSKYLVFSLSDIPAGDFTFEVIYSMVQGFGAEYPVDLVISVIDDTNSVYSVTSYPLTQPDGTYTQSSALTIPSNAGYLGIQFISQSYVINTYTINDVNILDCVPSGSTVQITEEKCFDVITICEPTYIPPTPDDIRLTEDGDFRILE